MTDNYINFEQPIKEKPSTFVGLVKRYKARAHDQKIYFTIPDEMLQRDKNPIKISWNNELELMGEFIQKSGLGWIDGHQIPGNKTILTIVYPKDKAHLVRGWDWLLGILEENGHIVVVDEKVKEKPTAPKLNAGAGWGRFPPKESKTWRYKFEIDFPLLTSSKKFWKWFDGKYPRHSGWDRTPLKNGVYKISHPNSDMYESMIKTIEEDSRITVMGEHHSAKGGRWHEELKERAEDYFGENDEKSVLNEKDKKPELISIAQGRWGSDIDTFTTAIMDFSLNQLKKPYGTHSFLFKIIENNAFSRPATKCWMLANHEYNRESLMTVDLGDGRLGPEGGWPYAEIRARESANGFIISFYKLQNHTDAIDTYIGEILTQLIFEGLALENIAHHQVSANEGNGENYFPESVQQETSQKADIQKQKAKKRKQGPSPEILSGCTDGMRFWLDNDNGLTRAADLAGVDRKTILKWIPNVLDLIDDNKRLNWIRKLKAIGRNDYLGKYRED